MIKSVRIVNHLNESITLELARPEKSGFAILSIEGLGPSKATINSTEVSTMDGAIFNSSRVVARNIVFDLRFLFKPTIEHIRQLSYKYFPVKRAIRMIFETDNRICETTGWVESNEPTIFSREEGCQISVICPDPYFYSLSKDSTIFSGIEPALEFPFSNESLTEPLIETGLVKHYIHRNVFYEGDVDIGVTIKIQANGLASGITIYHVSKNQVMKINTDAIEPITGSSFGLGDTIIISTVRGEKSVQLLRNGLYTNILNALDRYSDWFSLSKGDNVFSYSADSGEENLLFEIENKRVYEGV